MRKPVEPLRVEFVLGQDSLDEWFEVHRFSIPPGPADDKERAPATAPEWMKGAMAGAFSILLFGA
jgi:hypothetical protein